MKYRVDGVVALAETCDSKPELKLVEEGVEENGEKETEELILNHRENGRKLARSILRRWRVRMPADEIDSIVDLALCEAARRYCSERGATFMTFFFYHLRGHLVRAVTRAAQASHLFMAYSQNSGIDTTEWQRVTSDAVWSFIPDHFMFGQRDIATPEHEVLRKEKIDQCREAVTKLDDLEREIISRSFSKEQPLVDIARSLGYSRCHISRVKKSALERLKTIISGSEAAEDLAAVETQGEETFVDRSAPSRERPRRRSRRRTIANRSRVVARSSGTKAA